MTDVYDVVIVGAGIAGAMLADKLGSQGIKVVVLESGPGPLGGADRRQYLLNFKVSGQPYPIHPQAPKEPDFFSQKSDYYVPQPSARPPQGPVPAGDAVSGDPFAGTNIINRATATGDWYQSNYERQGGGSTWHWLGTSLRLVPNDFRLRTTWGPQVEGAQAQDWPIGYADLESYYGQAERAIGVAGPDQGEDYLGITRSSNYPMPPIPQSYLDQQFVRALDGQSFTDGWVNQHFPLQVAPTPQARNSVPSYNGRPQCKGSSSCIPICPIQAKYDATQHIATAVGNGVDLRYQAVATQVLVDTTKPALPITGIQYKRWDGTTQVVAGRIYVLAAHAVENAKLLLNSPCGSMTVANRSDQVGRNLADHPVSLVYGLTDDPVYGYRGPLSTSGVESLRDGSFRRYRGAFRMEIGNDGWTWPINDPYATPQDILTKQGLYGQALADAVSHRLVRQTRIGCLTEQLPNPSFRVQLSSLKDILGIPRPQLTYGIDAYGQRSLSAAVAASLQVFRRLIARPVIEYNYTDWSTGDLIRDGARSDPAGMGPPNLFVREGWAGAGHLMGTHRMGSDPTTSVVDGNQKAHDHANLYLLGSGNWPSYATGNPTLTIAALSLRAADAIAQQLRSGA